MKLVQLKKGEIIQRKGDLNHKVYHLEKGLLRSYSIDKNGKESIFMFAPEGWTMGDNNGPDVPAQLTIDALEDSTVRVFEKNLNAEQVNVAPLIKRLAVLQNRVMMLLSSNAIQRYDHFVETYPDIVQRVPQKMIASYLGITPEALSKVKSDRIRKK